MTDEEARDEKLALIRAYRLAFLSEMGQTVIKDLMGICRFRNSLVPLDLPQTTNDILIAEGRRQVFVHILQMIQLNEDQLLSIGKTTITELEDAA